MRLKRLRNAFPQDRWLTYFLVCAIVLGIFFQVVNLGKKPLQWLDEGFTLLRASGYTLAEVQQTDVAGRVIRAEDILKFQRPAPEKGIQGTIVGLATEEPQLPPLYFLLTRFWMQGFGDSRAAVLALPVLFSLLALPALYWLCQELFEDSSVAWLTMALYIVSPAMLYYAHYIRQYSLWLTLMITASALFLRCLKQPTKLNWSLYALTIVLGFYTHILMGFVVLAHGIYGFASDRFRKSRAIGSYLFTVGISIVLMLPWLWVVWAGRNTANQMTEWQQRNPITLLSLLVTWGKSLNRTFAAWHFNHEPVLFYLCIPIALLVAYAFYFLARHSSRSIWGFVFALMGTSFFPFLMADLLFGGRRATSERYFLICYVGIFLAVAYLLSRKIQPLPNTTSRQRQIWKVATVVILSIGLISCGTGALGKSWWGWSEFEVDVDPIVHQTSQPLVIAERDFWLFFQFAHQFKPDVQLLLLDRDNLSASLEIPAGEQQTFLYGPSDRLLAIARAQAQAVNLVYEFHDASTNYTFSLYEVIPWGTQG